MALNVINCTRCGKLCVRNSAEICKDCMRELEEQYEVCVRYLRENRGISLQELSDATEVPLKQIIRFIREGRISIVNSPNMSYPCEICGQPIREQAMCDSCRTKLSKDFSSIQESEKRREESRPTEPQIAYQIRDRLRDRRN